MTAALLSPSFAGLISSAITAVQDDPGGAFDWFSAHSSQRVSAGTAGSPHAADI